MKKELFDYIDSIRGKILNISDYIFDNPEIGLQEFKSSKILMDTLEEGGFKIEKEVADLPTAFRATMVKGDGGPSFGLLCEYDAIENEGHICAHHMQGAAIVGAAIALKEILKDNFKIVVYGTPAEETLGSKVEMIRKGCFKDIDVALMMHGSDCTTTDIKSLALSNFKVKFFGTPSHSALAPEKGRSALDGLLLSFQGIEFMREHIKEDTRIHYVITNGGGALNVVPKYAEAKFSLRSYNRPYLDSVIERFKKVIKGAALMTETEYEIEEIKSLNNKIPVLSLNEILMENAKMIEAPNITPPREKTGSTDFGNVMYELPGSCIRVSFVDKGVASHSNEFLKMGKSERAHEAVIYAAKILAGTVCDLLEPKRLEEVKNEFIKNKNY